MTTSKGGRPKAVDENTLRKLEAAFLAGCTDSEACLYANIAPSTLYNYQTENPDFTERKKALRENPKLRARLNVAHEIELQNIDVSKWYLERKAREEFGQRAEAAVSVTLEGLQDKETALQEYMSAFLGVDRPGAGQE